MPSAYGGPSVVIEPRALGKNRIINGDFRIDQRNQGAVKTVNTNVAGFGPDRWNRVGQLTDGVYTIQQVTDSVPASGAKYALKFVVITADASIGATQVYYFSQK